MYRAAQAHNMTSSMVRHNSNFAKSVTGAARPKRSPTPSRRDMPATQRPQRSQRQPGRDARQTQLARLATYTRAGAVAIVLLVVALFGGVQLAERDQIRAGVHAYGVNLSGMTAVEARTALLAATSERVNQPLRLTDGDRRWELTAAELGLTMDVQRALDEALAAGHEGRGASRLALLWHFRSEPHEVGVASIAVQAQVLDAQLARLEAEIFQEKVDPSLWLDGAAVQYVNHVVGRDLDVQRTRQDIINALATGQADVPLTIHETQPRAYDADYAAARGQLANALGGPIELVAADEVWTMQPHHIANWLTIHQAQAGEPARVELDDWWLDAVVWEIGLDIDRAPRSARVWWDVSGTLVKTEDGIPGRQLERDGSRELVRHAFLGYDASDRVELPVIIDYPPALPTDLSTLGITQKIAESSTPYGGGLPERMHNIELAARLLNGVIVMPGQTFSFNAEIGEMTVDAGFQIGYGIAEEDGEVRTIPAEAGGICQVATTVFQPVFWTGFEIAQRSTHLYWIPSYAYNGFVGMDATVEPAVGLDFKWTNNSTTAVLIEASTDGQNFTIILYGTPPDWRVEIDPPVITNRVEAQQETVYEPTTTIPNGTLRQIERAHEGFDVTIERRVIQGDQVDTYTLSATYAPSRNVVLVGTEATELPEGWQPPST
jgi:vancomycin resistance protein YoaR